MKSGTVSLDEVKITANSSKQRALSWDHLSRIEQHLRDEVEELMRVVERTGFIDT